MRTENDMMPVEIRAQDLTVGDLVNVGGEHRAVSSILALSDGVALGVDGDSRGYFLATDTPVTVRPVICADCGHCPSDCECVDAECPHCGVELDGYEVVELDAKSCFNCTDKET